MNGALVGILDPSCSYKYLGLNISLVEKEPNAFKKFLGRVQAVNQGPIEAATEDIFPSGTFASGIVPRTGTRRGRKLPVEQAGQVVQEEC